MSVITLDDIKAHLNVTITADDAMLTDKITAAQECVENFVGAKLDDAHEFPDGTPEPLKEAVRQLAAHFYENREPVLVGVTAQTLPLGVFDLVGPYRKWVF
jgi:Phage gp6-like head-tail connector protein